MKNRKLRNYCFEIDNIENGRNKKIQIFVFDVSLKKAEKQIKNIFGKLILSEVSFNFSENKDGSNVRH